MPLDSRLVGQATDPVEQQVDSRWLMAYAAGIADYSPQYLDNRQSGVIGHPLFPVCVEWPLNLMINALPYGDSVTAEEYARSVHASHDLHIHKPIMEGETYTTRLEVVGLRTIKPGTEQKLRIETFDSAGEPVATTWAGGIFRGVPVTGGDRSIAEQPAWPKSPGEGASVESYTVDVPAGAGNVYTETARIYNPIHSDMAYALKAGLPGVILHGTATLAMAVSQLVMGRLAGDSKRVKRIGCKFKGVVLMPNTLRVDALDDADNRTMHFEVRVANGELAISSGFLSYL